MGSNYKKIKYETQGIYGSIDIGTLYIKYERSNDTTTVYTEWGDELFSFDECGVFDMGEALKIAFSDWNHPKMENLTSKELDFIRNR